MVMNEKRIEILRDEKPLKAILSLSIPTILAMQVQVFYNLTDTFFVGKLNDPFQVAAVSVAFPIFMILMSLSGIFGFGAASYISRLLGKRDYMMAKKTSSIAFYICIMASIVVTVLGLAFISPILRLVGVTSETHSFAYDYLSIIFYGSIVVMLNFLLTLMIRSEGAAKVAMYGMFIGTGINIVLDPIFILALGYGVKGAAIATIIGQGVALLYYFNFYLRKKSMVSLHWKYFSFRSDILLEILKVGIPASSYNIMINITNIIGIYVAASYNDMIVAAFGINRRIFSMCIMTLTGLAEGTQPLIGYNYGARKIERMNKIIKTALVMAASVSFFFVFFFYLFAGKMIQIFISNKEVITYGIQIMRAMIISLPFIGIQFLIRTTFQALGKGRPALILALARDFFYIPALFALNKYFGFSGFIYAQPFSNASTFLLALFLFNSIRGQVSDEHREWKMANSVITTEATNPLEKDN